MIESEEHKENLIKFAEKLRNIPQSFPKDENGRPVEKYLEYLLSHDFTGVLRMALGDDIIGESFGKHCLVSSVRDEASAVVTTAVRTVLVLGFHHADNDKRHTVDQNLLTDRGTVAKQIGLEEVADKDNPAALFEIAVIDKT